MVKAILVFYKPLFIRTVIYMLQSTEYRAKPYLAWFWRTNDFNKVMHRKSLVMTRPAKLLLRFTQVGMLLQYAASIFLGIWGAKNHKPGVPEYAFALFISTPLVWSQLIVLPLLLAKWFITKPYGFWQIRSSAKAFVNNPAIKIAVAGSYGKTSMKEILFTVLNEGKRVAATPANKNVAVSHASFAAGLNGDEEILIIEYGEGAPGDVASFSRTTKPSIGIITGIAPAHLDRYKTLDAAAADIFSLADYLGGKDVYINGESPEAIKKAKKNYHIYNQGGVLGWKVHSVKTSLEGLSFEMHRSSTRLKLKSPLLGRHQIGPLALAVALASELGLTNKQIETGIAKTESFEHRMQPRPLSGGWLIDDTYNGNLEGVKAGLALLSELPAERRIYITPGLVDQGKETAAIHREIGKHISAAKPDMVVLMKNSVSKFIEDGLKEHGFRGELLIESDPLEFYSNLDQLVAAGDVVLMQNDWPDNYN